MKTEDHLRDLYHRGFDIPSYGNLAAVQTRGRTRRTRSRAAAATLTVATVGIAVVGIGQLVTTTPATPPSVGPDGAASTPPPNPDETTPPGPTQSFVAIQPGSAAPAGTVAYLTCDGGGCRLMLTSPGADAVDVADHIPELQPTIDSGNSIEGATLSYDAQWLGLPDGEGYLVASLRDRGAVAHVPDAPTGERWTPVGWTPSSGSLALARVGTSGVTALAMVDTSDPTGQNTTVHTLDVNPLPGWVPLYNGGDSVVMTRQRTPGETVTALEAQTVFISSDQFAPGERLAGHSPIDLSDCLAKGETLVSSTGAPTVTTPPPPGAPDVSHGAYLDLVLAHDVTTLTPTALLGFDCSRREFDDIPAGTSPVPRTTDTSQVTVRSDTTTQVILQGDASADERVVFEQDGPVQVTLPGQVP
jgi:hypothetical protein